jgi:bisphosphoglycerate-dependent phosphoglycerate mutase
MSKALVLVRHGQSEFNARNLFTGWADQPTDTTVKAREILAG